MSHCARYTLVFALCLAGVCLVTPGPTGVTSSPRTDVHSCPPDLSVPITGGSRGSLPVVFTGLGPVVHASFFTVGSADLNNSGDLPATAWVVPIGDVDGDGIPDYRVEAPGLGPGGWGDPRTTGCPAMATPTYPPVAVVLWHEREDNDPVRQDSPVDVAEGLFDVFEDRNGNGRLDEGEDLDGDGRVTPPDGCEGVLREDVDCDGHLDRIHEDFNSNGVLDPGEDIDGDRRLDAINEDRNGNGMIDWFDRNGNGLYDAGEPTEDTNLNGVLDLGPYVEDRNHDELMNDRVRPLPNDVLYEVTLEGVRLPLPASYPYGSFKPSPGGYAVVSVAWNEMAYDLSRISSDDLGILRPAEGFEDLDADTAFDVFEDRDLNGRLDPGEDIDGDGRLTPPDGCEGTHREDLDCDGFLDLINEDFNSNGILDLGEDLDGDRRLDLIEEDLDRDGRLDPGEDSNLNGRLDTGGRIEDRNRNQILDDRPFPSSEDVMVEFRPDGTQSRISATYPYGTFTATGTLRNVPASPLKDLTPRGVGVRQLSPTDWRMRVEAGPARTLDDAGGTRRVFSHAGIRLLCAGGLPPDPGADCPGYRFLEEPGGRLMAPIDASGAGGAYRTIQKGLPNDIVPSLPAAAVLLAAGSNGPVAAGMPVLEVGTLVDIDADLVPSPEDNCTDIRNFFQLDADRDGVGDHCDRPLADQDRWLPGAVLPGPGPRAGAGAVFDEARRVMVLFGGANDTATWEFAGTAWRPVSTPTGPSARQGHRMVYDDIRRRVLLFGGVRLADGAPLSDLWAFDGQTWTEILPPLSPFPRTGAGLAFDTVRDRLVLFGGADGARVFGDTWEFDGAAWRRVPTPQVPAARGAVQLTYDRIRQVVLLQGGSTTGSDPVLNDTWEFDGRSWQPVDHRGEVTRTSGATATFNPLRRQVVLFGGRSRLITRVPVFPTVITPPTATVREYDGLAWSVLPTENAPDPRRDHAAAFDPLRGLLIVHGGTGPSGILGDTVVLPLVGDADSDGVPDQVDNCPLAVNPDQRDADSDASGNVCDNCGMLFNPTQRDLDRDGLGDACDDDRDGDRVANDADVCPDSYVAGRPFDSVLQGGGPDTDGDGTADDCDFCPGNPDDDTDGDGVCGDADNCPLVANPLQEDGTGDGYGDACQTTVRVFPVRSRGEGTLSAQVVIGSPDGDPLAGQVSILPVIAVPDALSNLDQGCALAFRPDGIAGEGIVYAAHPGTPTIGDADEAFGCSDGVPDFALALGTCAEAGPGGLFQTVLTVPESAPYAICVKRISGAEALFDYLVWSVGATEMLLVPEGSPIVDVPYTDSQLPRTLQLGALPGPGRYVLRVTAADGTTPEASDQVLFTREKQNTLHLIQRRDRRPPA